MIKTRGGVQWECHSGQSESMLKGRSFVCLVVVDVGRKVSLSVILLIAISNLYNFQINRGQKLKSQEVANIGKIRCQELVQIYQLL